VTASTTNKAKNPGRGWFSVLGVVFLVALWELAALAFRSNLLFPGPLTVAKNFITLLPTSRFWQALGSSFLRVLLSLVISVPLGVLAGFFSGVFPQFERFLRPLLQLIAATPVMAVILIAFLWFGSEGTPIFAGFLMIFPVVTLNVEAGIRGVDRGLIEMTQIYHFSRAETTKNLYIPAIAPFIASALDTSLSLAWKVVIAAEVLVQPIRALGTNMQTAKAQLETPSLFAWTIAAVLAAALCHVILGIFNHGKHGHYGKMTKKAAE
jgi:NitT/TauT family transport system permease protein